MNVLHGSNLHRHWRSKLKAYTACCCGAQEIRRSTKDDDTCMALAIPFYLIERQTRPEHEGIDDKRLALPLFVLTPCASFGLELRG